MDGRLHHLQMHDAYCPVWHSFALLRLLYTLRMALCSKSPQLRQFDLLLRSLLGETVKINIANDDTAQASLPVWSGGLGVKCATQLAPVVYAHIIFSVCLCHCVSRDWCTCAVKFVPHVWLQSSEVIEKCSLIVYGISRRRPHDITSGNEGVR